MDASLAPAAATPATIRLADYQPPAWAIDTVDLRVDLREEHATVTATLAVRRQSHAPLAPAPLPLVLDGSGLELLSVTVDGAVPAHTATPERLVIDGLGDQARITITTRIRPQDNTALQGLYKSSGTYCTQCEAEGFRRITYFLDRPDVMARYTTTIVADKARYPLLLSNGNLVAEGAVADEPGRHWATWNDPWPKPSYLFAMVAGALATVEDRFTIRSGRTVTLRIHVEPGNEDRCGHAMESLKKSMAWDEEVYGREYDLDIFNIVAVSDFNMGAMENKSLNIFNTKYILAKPETATDTDFLGIETVVAHEYFHNWTGNRITCRDWFQLSLKEGLTVFRDQEFSADMHSAPVKRIQDVQRLRGVQFIEDAGATAHPVRPDSYIEINNFYTPTVYDKGAEVLRMYRTLLGNAGYRRGTDLYFERHDGQAVTTDDFLAAMVEANGQSPDDARWRQFRLWYTQAGTPTVHGTGHFDPASRTYRLDLRQTIPATPGQSDKAPMLIPVAVGLIGPDGRDLPLTLAGETAGASTTTRVLELRDAAQSFTFTGVDAAPVPSLLRGFSAPVRLDFAYDDRDLTFLMAHDSDAFNRWEAGQTLAARLILRLVAHKRFTADAVPQDFIDAFAAGLDRWREDGAFTALALSLPSESYLGQQMAQIDVDGLHTARQLVRRTLAAALRDRLLAVYEAAHEPAAAGVPFSVTAQAMGRRAVKNLALGYLMALDDAQAQALALAQYRDGGAMTDTIAALALINDSAHLERQACLDDFAARWQADPLVMDKWFAIQALGHAPQTLDRVKTLLAHPGFTLRNPNKVYALIGSFAANQARFHAGDGSGYAFLADQVIALDRLNPQVASRMVKPLARWKPFDAQRRTHARAALERIAAVAELSRDVREIVIKSLED